MSCDTTLADQARDSNTPVQLVHDHPPTDHPGVLWHYLFNLCMIHPCDR